MEARPASIIIFLFVWWMFSGSNSQCKTSSWVLQLTNSNFKHKVDIFASQADKSPWEKVAEILKGLATVVAVDADAQVSLTQKYKIRRFPTKMIFVPEKPPFEYQRVEPIIEVAFKQDHAVGKTSRNLDSSLPFLKLNPSNFKSEVVDLDSVVVVGFFSPWYRKCRALWMKAAFVLKGPFWPDFDFRL